MLYKFISTHQPGLKERAVYILTASNVVMVIVKNDLLIFK